MCKELEEELERGDKAAQLLVEHLEAMGADSATIPVRFGIREYKITIEYVGY